MKYRKSNKLRYDYNIYDYMNTKTIKKYKKDNNKKYKNIKMIHNPLHASFFQDFSLFFGVTYRVTRENI